MVGASAAVVRWAATRAETRRVRRIGILALGEPGHIAGPQPGSPDVAAFVEAMGDLGYAWGRDFVTETRAAAGHPERYGPLGDELVASGVDVIVAAGPTLSALRRVTRTTPVVMAASGDPVGLGLVDTLAHPGGNFTGLSLESVELTGKRLSILKQIVPGAAAIGVLWDASSRLYWQAAERMAKQQRWTLLSLELDGAADVEVAVRHAQASHAGSVLVAAAGMLFPRAREVARRMIEARLPAMFELRPYVEAGGLVSYGADTLAVWRRAAGYVDRILKGAKAADLPVEQPTRFELVVNLVTAAALGINVPAGVLLEAKVVR